MVFDQGMTGVSHLHPIIPTTGGRVRIAEMAMTAADRIDPDAGGCPNGVWPSKFWAIMASCAIDASGMGLCPDIS